MFLTELFESTQEKHAAFCFGRMNPPTVGHAQLINTVESAAQGGDYFVFVSQTQDRKDNPLDYTTKIKFLKALFPQQAGHVVFDIQLKTIMQVADWLYGKGYTSVTFAAGSDRMEAFQKLLESYNGVQRADGYYKFILNFVSSGEREDGAEGVEGVSASQARAAAVANNMDAFTKSTGAGELAPQLFQAVRNGMGLVESVEQTTIEQDPKPGYYFYNISPEQRIAAIKAGLRQTMSGKWNYEVKDAKKWHRSSTASKMDQMKIEHCDKMFGAHKFWAPKVAEDAAGVGVVASNKKMAKDPRYSTSMTQDIQPSTPAKNLKAFKLA